MNTQLIKWHFTLLILFYIVPGSICAQNDDSSTHNENASDTVQIEYEELDWDCLCVPKYKYIIIKSYSDLQYYCRRGYASSCIQIDSTLVDFNKEVIIGFRTSVGGCPGLKDQLNVTVSRIDSEQKYICRVPNSIGNCKALFRVVKFLCFPITHRDYMIEVHDKKKFLSETKINCYEKD